MMTLNAGEHIMEIKYANNGKETYSGGQWTGGPSLSALWVEVFRNNLTSIQTVTSDAQLNTIFSTASLVGPNGFDYIAVDADSSPLCPAGFSYNVCSTQPTCRKTETSACLNMGPKH